MTAVVKAMISIKSISKHSSAVAKLDGFWEFPNSYHRSDQNLCVFVIRCQYLYSLAVATLFSAFSVR